MAQDVVADRQQVTPLGARVLAELSKRHRRSIRFPEDQEWLSQITPHATRLLNRMKDDRVLYHLGRKQYVTAPIGTKSWRQAVPAELIIDLTLSPPGPYYIGFLSALIAHRLTDLHSQAYYAAVQEGSNYRPAKEPVIELTVVRLSPSNWPEASSNELERFRILEGTKEFAWRSSQERTLIDGLLRPDCCAGFETVVSAWARALQNPATSWDEVALIGRRLGDATARRTAFMLGLLGLEGVVARHFADLNGRQTTAPLDRSNGFSLPRAEMERDRRTGVLLNVPRNHLRGWLTGEGMG